MCPRLHKNTIAAMTGYTYPKLHKGKEWYVDFYAVDPLTEKMRRKKYWIGGSDMRIAEKNRKASEIISVITKQLMKGWNPWVKAEEARGYALFDDCLDRYLEYVDRKDRKKTRQSYTSRVNILRKFVSTQATPIKFIYQFDSAFCTEFLDWIYLDRGSNPRTRNNYRGWLYGLAEFFLARKRIVSNPVEHIKNMPVQDKYRKDLTPAMLKQMSVHLSKKDKPFLLACMMQYYTLIRPGELSNLKIKDISVANQTIFVSHEFSKNRRDAEVGLNKTIIKLMLELQIFSHPDDCYIFGSDFLPSKKKIGADHFNKRWKVMRDELKWSDCYQFYSLKDSGIRDLANEQGVVVARDQARHSDITTTNKYIQHHGVQQVTLGFEGNLTFDDEGQN